jgi:N-acyl-D-aspartate/D-glutamate deacylase
MLLGVSPAKAVVQISVASNGASEVINHCLSPTDVDEALTLPFAAVSSDGYALPMDAFGSVPHPRSFGAFTRFLRSYVLDRKLMTLGEGIRKITSLPSDIVGLSSIGRLAARARADIVVIRPSELADRATYAEPRELAHGIVEVVVGGEAMSIESTGVKSPAGSVLKR